MPDSDDTPLISYVLATYNRPADLRDCVDSIRAQEYQPIEIIVVSSSTDSTSDLFEPGGRFDDDAIEYYEFSERMGVPEARNIGYKYASGEILVTIDDDAALADPGATRELVSLFREQEDVGAIAFQSRNYETDELVQMEVPAPPDFRTPVTTSYRTTSFTGVGNAIRRTALEEVGPYPGHFVYGFEEIDLSIRLIDSGYDILYAPSIVVRHKKSPTSRRPDREIEQRRVENRIKIAARNLPKRYVLFTAVIWSFYWLARSGVDVKSLFRMYWRLFEQRRVLLDERDLVAPRTIPVIKSRLDMLYFWWLGPNFKRLLFDPRWKFRERIAW